MPLLSQVPEIRAAIEEEAETRDAAFLEAACDIAGVNVLPLTLRRYLLLLASKNAFVTGGAITREEAAQFLWCVSGDYNPNKKGMDAFIKALGDRWAAVDSYAGAVAGILDYIAFAFFDGPKVDPDAPPIDPPPSYYSVAVPYVSILAREYGWGWREVLDTPLPVLLQMLKRVEQENNGGRAILFNPLSDPAKSAYARSLNP